jgi:hypothetical protein
LLRRRAGGVVESEALAEGEDEVDEIRVGGDHGC